MKKYFLIYLILLVTTIQLYCQGFCATPNSSHNSSLNNNMRGTTSLSGMVNLRIYVHSIRKSNGSGGQLIMNIQSGINIMKNDFANHNITFDWDGIINFIDNDSYYLNPDTYIYNVDNHCDGIDIYIFDENAVSTGRANGVGESSEFFISGNLVNTSVMSHEMGHVLFLWHTHHGTFLNKEILINVLS